MDDYKGNRAKNIWFTSSDVNSMYWTSMSPFQGSYKFCMKESYKNPYSSSDKMNYIKNQIKLAKRKNKWKRSHRC